MLGLRVSDEAVELKWKIRKYFVTLTLPYFG